MQADGALLANSDEATGKMDLLTVVMHELGHVLGFEDIAEDTDASDLMSEILDVSVRNTPVDTQDAPEITVAPTNESIAPETPVVMTVPEPVVTEPEVTQLPSPNKNTSTLPSSKNAKSRSK